MKALILAAGYGNRMRPLTDRTHKTLLQVGGKTIIRRILDGLSDNGVTEVCVVTGYRADELETHLRDHFKDFTFQFVRNERYPETNNIYSMALAFEQMTLESDLLLIESDLIYEPAVIRRAIDSPFPNVALVAPYRGGMDGTVVTVSDTIITSVIPTHLQTGDFRFAGKYKTLNIYKFSSEFCRTTFRKLLTYYARVIDDNCYYELILGILTYMQQASIHAEVMDQERFAEIDDPNDLRIAEYVFNPGTRREILEATLGGYWAVEVLDFCFIRNMYFPNASILSELRNNLPSLLHNYGSTQDHLNQKLAYFLLCDVRNVNVLNGASEIYPLFKSQFAGRKALIPAPTFGEYPRVFPDHITYADQVGIDFGAIEQKSNDVSVVVFVNPNNPTGTTLETQRIYDFARNNPEKVCIVDESFIEFAGVRSMRETLESSPLANVIVVKSLSKSLGVPGLRLGYVYCTDPKVNARYREAMPIWNLNSVAENFLEIILKHRKSLAESFVQTIQDREGFARGLRHVPGVAKVYPSGADFLLATCHRPREALAALVSRLLEERSIFVKDVSSKFTDGKSYLRFAVRLPGENRLLCQALADCL
jgi:histidinol-phosphate/aromatic aminotransferase/cobyric acid decarboxylase-like protein/choline kinase